MKKFNVTIDGKTTMISAKSKRDLRIMLRRKLNKQHLIGVTIEEIRKQKIELKPGIIFAREGCHICGEKQDCLLTIDERYLMARLICENCLKNIKKEKQNAKLEN